jgi:hypothetical protein
MAETRKIIDCRNFPGEKPCSIAILIHANVDRFPARSAA